MTPQADGRLADRHGLHGAASRRALPSPARLSWPLATLIIVALCLGLWSGLIVLAERWL